MINSMPDITIVPIDKWSIAFKPDLADQEIIAINLENTFHVGTHHQDGIFVARGKNVLPGKVETLDLVDVAPTIFWLLNLKDDSIKFDGKIIDNIWTDDFACLVNGTKAIDVMPSEGNSSKPDNFGDDEKNILEKRLNDLGYM